MELVPHIQFGIQKEIKRVEEGFKRQENELKAQAIIKKKELDDICKAYDAEKMKIPKALELGFQLLEMNNEHAHWNARNDEEWMYSRIYGHIITRIKDDQLHLEGPNQKLNYELNYCRN